MIIKFDFWIITRARIFMKLVKFSSFFGLAIKFVIEEDICFFVFFFLGEMVKLCHVVI